MRSSDEGRSWYRGGDAGVEVRIASRFSTSVAATYDRVINDQQWVGNYGAALSDTTHFTFARLDQNILAITTSEIKISVLIEAAYAELAVRTLHTLYGLDAD